MHIKADTKNTKQNLSEYAYVLVRMLF